MPIHAGDAGHESAPARGRSRFLWIWLAVVAAGGIAGLPVLNLALLNWRSNPNVRWVDELWQRKRAMARKAAGQPRIFIVGGSSVLFSIDAEVLQARLGRPVINLGMMAGLGLRHTLDDAREVMASGDTVLLHIEYEAYQWKDELTDFQRQVLLTNHPGRLLHLPWRKAAALIYGAPWSDYAAGWQRRNEEMRSARPSAPLKDARYTSVELSPCGDCRGEGVAEASGFRRYPLGPVQRGPGAESAARLREFLEDCRRAGVKVIAMRPVGYPAGNPSPEVIEAAYRGFARFYEENGVAVIENRELFVAPRAMMLDTAYHANAAGRRVITETVVQELRRIFDLPRPIDLQPMLLVSPLERNGAGRAVVKPAQEFSSCLLLTEQELPYAGSIAPAGVRERVRKGERVIVNDRETAALVRKAGLALAPLEEKRSTLDSWVREYPNHLFALAQVGSFETAVFADELMPAAMRAFLKDRAPCKVGVFGTGRYASINARRVKAEEAGLERSRYSEFARAFRQPLDIALLSTLQPIAAGKETGARVAAERCAIRIDHYAIEDGATAGLAVAILDPELGLVVKHTTWTARQLVEWEQNEVRGPAEAAPR